MNEYDLLKAQGVFDSANSVPIEDAELLGTQTPVVAAPNTPSTKNLVDLINQKQIESINAQRKGLATQEARLATLSQQEAKPDLSPLLSLADSWAGTNLSRNYKRPMSGEERQVLVAKLNDELQKRRGDISKEEVDLLKAGLSASERQTQNAATNEYRNKLLNLREKALEKEKQPSHQQTMLAGYTKRLEQGEQVFDDLAKQGYDRASRMESIKSPLPGEFHGNALRQQEQAERNFVNSLLRPESGAAISESEFANARQQYFPRPGDTPEVIAQKRANRQQVIENFKAGAGTAYQRVPTVKVPMRNQSPLTNTEATELQQLRAKYGR
jgi:hypothetical protein